MADSAAMKFIEDQLVKAGMQPSADDILDYAMATVALLMEINMELHQRLKAQRPKKRRSRKPQLHDRSE